MSVKSDTDKYENCKIKPLSWTPFFFNRNKEVAAEGETGQQQV